VIAVDRTAAEPLHQQIYEVYRARIQGGNLQPGQPVPSTRALALELGISRMPVINAYDRLISEGYFESRAGAGTFVSRSQHDEVPRPRETMRTPLVNFTAPRLISRRCQQISARRQGPWIDAAGPFGIGHLAFDHFPFEVWSKLMVRHARATSPRHFDPMGSPQLRDAIAAYLRSARAVDCDSRQIMIVSGPRQAVDIAARVLLDPGTPVWIEEPGDPRMSDALSLAGCRPIPVPVDDEGLEVNAGIARGPRAGAAYVTPSHQFPLGIAMPPERRLQLLDWVNRTGAWILEDDYAGECNYESPPAAPLQGLDRNGRVIYIGTLIGTRFPSLRMGYMVIPFDLIDRFAAVRRVMDESPPPLYEKVMTHFIRDGHFARHVRKTRLLCSERRSALVEALRSEFGPELQISGQAAGMHLVVILPDGMPDREIAVRAAQDGLMVCPLSDFYQGDRVRQGLILGFGGANPTEMPFAVSRLRRIMKVPK